jgi:signal transduction histidine kinase
LITAREEERRRLRRDLHDGLGPQLSSQPLLMTSALMLLRQDPGEAEAILNSAITQSQEAISDIRRLVYALRPPALDDLGLIAAIGELFTQYRASGITFSIEIPEPLPPLPAAVEVACYRIVQEALTNVVRHAHAHTCVLRLVCREQVTIEIIDDGQGLPPAYRHGVGLTSMRERAEELGGRWLIEPRPTGGTCVRAQIPYR